MKMFISFLKGFLGSRDCQNGENSIQITNLLLLCSFLPVISQLNNVNVAVNLLGFSLLDLSTCQSDQATIWELFTYLFQRFSLTV